MSCLNNNCQTYQPLLARLSDRSTPCFHGFGLLRRNGSCANWNNLPLSDIDWSCSFMKNKHDVCAPTRKRYLYFCEHSPQQNKTKKLVTWQRSRSGLAAGGTQEFDVRGMKPASLTLLTSSLVVKRHENKIFYWTYSNSGLKDELTTTVLMHSRLHQTQATCGVDWQ